MKKLVDLNEGKSGFEKEVPWHSTYAQEKGNVGNETLVTKVVLCNTGLLIIGRDFKDYVYKGKKAYDMMIEALEYYISRPTDSYPWIMEATDKKSSIIGVLEGYEGTGYWIKEKKGYSFGSDPDTETSTPSSNPFLPPTSYKPAIGKNSGTANRKKTS